MKILTVHNYYQLPGGEDTIFTDEQAMLRDNGHEVIEYMDHNRRIPEMGWGTLAFNTFWSQSSYRKLQALIQKTRPEVAHFHNTFPLISPAAYYACAREKVPVVQSLHNYRLMCPAATLMRDEQICELCLGKVPLPGIRYACYRNSRTQTAVVVSMLTLHRWLKTWQRHVSIYVVNTQFARQKFIDVGIPARRLYIKPNFIDPDPGMGDNRENFGLFVGRLSPEKGIRTLLETWKRLRGIPLKVVGDGPLKDELGGYVAKHKLYGIELLGQQSRVEVLKLMKTSRVLVFPSIWYEGLPMTLTEAFACGVPVVTSNLGAMSEIVDDRRTGLHFEPGNATDLAAKVDWAWSHPNEMESMGKAARKEYEQKYTADKNSVMLMEIYQQAIHDVA